MQKMFFPLAAISFLVVFAAIFLFREPKTSPQPSPLTIEDSGATECAQIPDRKPEIASGSVTERKAWQSDLPEEAFIPQTGRTTQSVLKDVLAISISRAESSK